MLLPQSTTGRLVAFAAGPFVVLMIALAVMVYAVQVWPY
jgi:hypothetical protein